MIRAAFEPRNTRDLRPSEEEPMTRSSAPCQSTAPRAPFQSLPMPTASSTRRSSSTPSTAAGGVTHEPRATRAEEPPGSAPLRGGADDAALRAMPVDGPEGALPVLAAAARLLAPTLFVDAVDGGRLQLPQVIDVLPTA